MVRSATRAGAEQMIRREGEPARLTNQFDTGDRNMDGDPVTTREQVYRRAQFSEPTSSQESQTPFGESVAYFVAAIQHIRVDEDSRIRFDRFAERRL